MAWSRLEKVGTIFSRVNGLIRSGALKEEDKPIWYELYKRFPPLDEPRFDRPAKDVAVRKIFYSEDVLRAKFYRKHGEYIQENLADHSAVTKCQRFIEIYRSLKDQGTFGEEELFDKSAEVLGLRSVVEGGDRRVASGGESTSGGAGVGSQETTIASNFRKAQARQGTEGQVSTTINVKDLFKDG